jgi:hypothetical protein
MVPGFLWGWNLSEMVLINRTIARFGTTFRGFRVGVGRLRFFVTVLMRKKGGKRIPPYK